MLTEEIAQLQQSHTTMVAKIAECKRQLLLLSHRVLKVRPHCYRSVFHIFLYVYMCIAMTTGDGGPRGIKKEWLLCSARRRKAQVMITLLFLWNSHLTLHLKHCHQFIANPHNSAVTSCSPTLASFPCLEVYAVELIDVILRMQWSSPKFPSVRQGMTVSGVLIF